MNNATSIYLDGVRFTAALLVLLIHASSPRFTSGWLYWLRNAGNDTVMLFFVLSGFVIAYCVDSRDSNFRIYTINRLSRLYSVVLPALIIMAALNYLGYVLNLEFHDGTPWHFTPTAAMEFLTSLAFLNQLWFLNIAPFSNGPFWSAAYEFWFYALFAAYHFNSGKNRTLWVGFILLIIGPKILLLLPVWLLGVASYKVAKQELISPRIGSLLFVGSFFLYALFSYLEIEKILNWYSLKIFGKEIFDIHLGLSRSFVASYMVGILVSINFLGFSAMSSKIKPPTTETNVSIRIARYLASFTFTLYLLHYPLLDFWSALIKSNPQNATDQFLLFGLVLGSIWIVGCCTERQKPLFKYYLGKLSPAAWRREISRVSP